MRDKVEKVVLDLEEENRLIKLAESGDSVAREKLITDNIFVSKQVAYSLVKNKHLSEEDIEDEVQDAAMVLVGVIDYMIDKKYDYNINYLRNCVRSRLIDSFRKKKYGIRESLNIEDFKVETEQFSDKKDYTKEVEDKMMVDVILDSLSDEDRKLVEMRFFEGKNQEEISRELGIAQCTVSIKLKEILSKLKENFS